MTKPGSECHLLDPFGTTLRPLVKVVANITLLFFCSCFKRDIPLELMLNDSTNKKESHLLWHGIILSQYHETLCPNIISATVFRLPLSERCNVSQCSCNRPKQHPAPSTFLPFPAAFAIATLLARRGAWSKSIPCTASARALAKHP